MTIQEVIEQEKKIWMWYCLTLKKFWSVDFEILEEGHIYQFSDLYLNTEEMKLCIINKVSYKKMLEYQDGIQAGKKQNLKNFLRYGWIKK